MNLVIYGVGSMARVLYAYLKPVCSVVAFTVDDAVFADTDVSALPLPVVPFSTVETRYSPLTHQMLVVVGYLGMNQLRQQKMADARAKGYRLASYIHPSLQHHDDVVIGENCMILEHCSIHPGAVIGEGSFMAGNVNIGHDSHIGMQNWINGGVSMAGGVVTGERCFFGVNAAVVHNVELGDATFVGASTLVSRDTAAGAVIVSAQGETLPMNSERFLRVSGI